MSCGDVYEIENRLFLQLAESAETGAGLFVTLARRQEVKNGQQVRGCDPHYAYFYINLNLPGKRLREVFALLHKFVEFQPASFPAPKLKLNGIHIRKIQACALRKGYVPQNLQKYFSGGEEYLF